MLVCYLRVLRGFGWLWLLVCVGLYDTVSAWVACGWFRSLVYVGLLCLEGWLVFGVYSVSILECLVYV